MKTTARKTFRVLAERDDDWWVLSSPDKANFFSQAKRLSRAEYMARDAIGLLLDVDPDSVPVVLDHVIIDEDSDEAVAAARQSRACAEAAVADANAKTEFAVRLLRKKGLPMRDIGDLLGVSFQRVSQIARGASR